MATTTSSKKRWSMANDALVTGAALSLIAAATVFLLGVIWTRGVYGSRMAWLLGVVLPLLALAAVLAFAAGRYGVKADSVDAERATLPGSRDGDGRRRGARVVGVASLILVGIPFVFAGMLVLTYGLLFIVHWLR